MSGKRETSTSKNRPRRSIAVRARLRCTMICATFLLCYLFTLSTHLTLVAGHAAEQQQSLTQDGPGGGHEELQGPKHDNVHRLMSEQDLRRTFQVDSHDQVPEYEILKLTVNDDGSHLISPISDLGELTTTTTTTTTAYQHQHPEHHEPGARTTTTHPSRKTTTQTSLDASSSRTLRHKRSAASPGQVSGAGEQVARDSTQDAKAEAEEESRSRAQAATAAAGDEREDNKLIVMKLSTFGKDFKLRLKRNVDFQQRIKDMKMFMAESTGDGQLRYTEIKSQQQRKQEPHKREAGNDDDTESQPSSPGANIEPSAGGLAPGADQQQARQTNGQAPPKRSSEATGSVWNIGSTYHDEDNLAALLIDHDKRTGQLQVDGTIGNDFVIKPMPQATIDALLVKRQQQQQQEQSADTWPSNSDRSTSSKPTLVEDNSTAAATTNVSAAPAAATNQQRSGTSAKLQQFQRAIHMHDDDPHDDDEMFLDEDEAIELAQIQSAAAESNQTKPQVQQGRALSKAASERKWRKYRKLMAQTQVPKPGSFGQRARRHAEPQEPRAVQVSHHIVYRQKPSSEGSSSEHQHSFMVAPGQQAAMEQLAARFQRSPSNTVDEADSLHDPLGGQFYLEPGTVTGVERAGYSDWSLLGSRRMASLPPYALNSTGGHANSTRRGARFRRHAGRMGPPVNQRRKRQAPDTVWPEVLLVVDYDSFLLHGGDSRDVKRYFVSFWNGVDLRYKLLVHPHIRISLAGMIVAKDRDATPYLERNRLRAPNADAVDAAGALTDMGKYLYREDRLPTYDLAVVITKLDMCRRRYEGGRCNRGTAGFAYVGGACVVNKRLEKVNSVAIIEDSGGFSGIIVAAHEVGHLLGCVHDGSPPPSYLGGPGATHCPWEDGFIMSDLRHTERGFRWSQCSVEQFKHFLNGETATCLYNYPHESQMLHRLLPGTMLTLDEQCKRDRGTNACFKDARVCAQLFCFDSASGYCVSYRPAAEGSPCGEGQVCRNGKCVGEIENIIPDYTHQSQTVVARGRGSHGNSVARLADNGLSASSTSTATASPPDSAKPAVMVKAVASPQLSSRMDTYPIDTPTYSSASYPFGGRYSQAASTVTSSATTVPVHPTTTVQKSAKLVAGGYQLAAKPQPAAQYTQRSGHLAAPKGSASSGANQRHSTPKHQTTALYASATSSSMSHLHPSQSGNNNLLTSASTIPAASAASSSATTRDTNTSTRLAQQHQLPHYDNKRIMYQQHNHQATGPNANGNQHQVNNQVHNSNQLHNSNNNVNPYNQRAFSSNGPAKARQQ